jgi:hypothetical protein
MGSVGFTGVDLLRVYSCSDVVANRFVDSKRLQVEESSEGRSLRLVYLIGPSPIRLLFPCSDR